MPIESVNIHTSAK